MTPIRLLAQSQRDYAKQCIDNAPAGYIVRIAEPKRSDIQSDKMWAMIDDVRRAKPEGRHWTKDVWKSAFMNHLGHQVQFAEGLDGSGPFPVGFRSSRLSVKQMSDLIECIYEYGSRHGVVWSEPERVL